MFLKEQTIPPPTPKPCIFHLSLYLNWNVVPVLYKVPGVGRGDTFLMGVQSWVLIAFTLRQYSETILCLSLSR